MSTDNKFRPAVSPAFVVLAFVVLQSVQAQQPAPRDPDAGTASILGRVTRADTGEPVRRAQIRAGAPGVPLARFATTDDDGRFVLAGLPAGKWSLSASRAGYVAQRFGQRRPSQAVDPIELANGARFTTADFPLLRGGVIAGRVYDQFGEAIAGIRVQALSAQLVDGFRRLTPVGISDLSDDTGGYRLYGLAPGDYFVAASLRAEGVQPPEGDSANYAPTYFPGTGTLAEAQRITVAAGDEQTASFALLPVRTAQVSGVAMASSGQPLGNGNVRLVPSELADTGRLITATVLPNGTFTIVNVPPGNYFLEVQAGPGLANAEPEVASMPLTVGNGDVRGVTVVTGLGSVVTGSVRYDPPGGMPPRGSLRLNARMIRGPGETIRGATIAATNTFRLPGLVGPYAFRVDGLPDTWAVKAFTLNGVDVIDSVVDFTGTERITQAELVLTDRVTSLSGRVTQRANATRDYAVVVFADDPAKWTYPSRYLRSARSGADGRFSIKGLPPAARYRAIAVEYLEVGEDGDPSFLAAVRERATLFSLGDGETRMLDLTLVER